MNETKFRIYYERNYKIITRRNKLDRLYFIDSNNRELIILIETICADDFNIPSIIILII
jgi:hypothetical protein